MRFINTKAPGFIHKVNQERERAGREKEASSLKKKPIHLKENKTSILSR